MTFSTIDIQDGFQQFLRLFKILKVISVRLFIYPIILYLNIQNDDEKRAIFTSFTSVVLKGTGVHQRA